MIFDERKEKELVWTKLRDNLKTKTNVVVTQDSSARRLEAGRKTSQASPRNRVQPGRDHTVTGGIISSHKTGVFCQNLYGLTEPKKARTKTLQGPLP